MRRRAQQICIAAFDKSLRLEEANPRRRITETEVKQRTKKSDWRSHARVRWEEVVNGAKPCEFPSVRPPWEKGCTMQFSVAMQRKSDKEDDNRNQAMRVLHEETAAVDYTVYTDGSVTNSVGNGGAGVVVTRGPPDNLVVEERRWYAAGAMASSYQAEMVAMREALSTVAERGPPGSKVAIVTDSKSTLDRLKSLRTTSKPETHTESSIMEHMTNLLEMDISLHIIWVPSHCGIPGNEEADRVAARGCGEPQEAAEVPFKTAKAAIMRSVKEEPIQHERLRQVYGTNRELFGGRAEGSLPRRDQVTMSRLRSGHHPNLRYWTHKVGKDESDQCRLCNTGKETAEHVIMHCPATTPTHHEDTPNILNEHNICLQRWRDWLVRTDQ